MTVEKMILACPACGKKLRVPNTNNSTLRITCPHCHNAFIQGMLDNGGNKSSETTSETTEYDNGLRDLSQLILTGLIGVLLGSYYYFPQADHFAGWLLFSFALFISYALLEGIREKFFEKQPPGSPSLLATALSFTHLVLFFTISWSWAGTAMENREQPWQTVSGWLSEEPPPIIAKETRTESADPDALQTALDAALVTPATQQQPETKTTTENTDTAVKQVTPYVDANLEWCQANRKGLTTLRDQIDTANKELPGQRSHIAAENKEGNLSKYVIERSMANGHHMDDAIAEHNRKRKSLEAKIRSYNRENNLLELRTREYNDRLPEFNRRCGRQ